MKFQRNRKITNPNHKKMTVNVKEDIAFKDALKMLDKALKIVAKRM